MDYLQEYSDRVKPLVDQNELFGKIQNEFEKKWETGTFPGWPVSKDQCTFQTAVHVTSMNSNTMKQPVCVHPPPPSIFKMQQDASEKVLNRTRSV